ncbi:glutamate mutase L [bacterium]|nr:glutamate mutase L [bacterium]
MSHSNLLILVTDCGSTTTKAILFAETSDGWKVAARGEAPTTVEKPLADVTIGARNAFLEVQELFQRKILNDSPATELPPFIAKSSDSGIDLYLSTSSAGGGLQMIVAGAVSNMSALSAEKAALGAGAIVMDTLAFDDGRDDKDRINQIRHLKPDIVLIAGGVDGGSITHPLELTELLLQANPHPRFGETLKLPVIYAGNQSARESAEKILGNKFAFHAVKNIRPTLEEETLAPARDAIHDLFLHHVMSHAPGYKTLLSWTPKPILPTPAAVGNMIQTTAEKLKKSVLAVDIGGATTDVFTAIYNTNESSNDPTINFNRSVSANLGMSYSVGNVLKESGIKNIRRHLPYNAEEHELESIILNKMIRPTSIPQTTADLLLEQAICREALRLSFVQHQRLASGLKGLRRARTIGDVFKQGTQQPSGLTIDQIDLIIGSGGVLSHAPNRASAALMLIDAFLPVGVTELAVDSIFMLPHLGVLATEYPQAAFELLIKECLVPLGTVISPNFVNQRSMELFSIEIAGRAEEKITTGTLKVIPLESNTNVSCKITPLSHNVEFGKYGSKAFTTSLSGGSVGIIIDARGRPLVESSDPELQVKNTAGWHRALNISLGGSSNE